MDITALNSAPGLSGLNSQGKISTGIGKTSEGFGSLVRDAVKSLDGTQKAADQAISRAVTGESPDLHRTIIELQSADLKFQFGLQVRNKLIGAYEEIMRMQV